MPINRRKLLTLAAPLAATPFAARALAGSGAGSGAHDGHKAAGAGGAVEHRDMVHGGASGATFRDGGGVDHRANGFDPTEILRDFDYGDVTTDADGRTVRTWRLVATAHDIEIAPGVTFPAWTFNNRVPGPTLRCTEGDLLRVHLINASPHPHTAHFHGIHPSSMDGVPGEGAGLIQPGGSTTYEFDAVPFGLHLFHCHAAPLAEHIARGMYGTFIIDPKDGRPPADEMVMVMAGYNTTFDAQGNQLYTVNGIPFCYVERPVQVKRGKPVRIYLVNVLEYDMINSFHLHANFFNWYPTGTSLTPIEYTDTVILGQGQRGILEVTFPYTGRYMFHAHKTEFADLGWMGFFEVVE